MFPLETIETQLFCPPMALSSELLGMYCGRKDSKEEGDCFKKIIQNRASNIRHSENRAMKEQAIQYYIDNREMLVSKENASYVISQKIVPASSSTIKGWLKNV